ncbi:MKS3-like protein [Mya arenaria]|uniref:MKS3-like protein n=1 Tax=Mya arenaria TaxID=6604 RepID=A0ABY7F1B5_MYAAR|nr:MKS3-like protein [Mya arenaria]
MASASIFRVVLSVILINYVKTQLSYFSFSSAITLKTVSDCIQEGPVREFYDISKLNCIQCSQDSTFQTQSVNGLSCVCQPGYRYIKNFGGTEVQCAPCAANEVVSSSGYECVQCPTGSAPDAVTKVCTPACTEGAISPERNIEGVLLQTRQCQECVNGTTPNKLNNRCELCTNVMLNMTHPAIGTKNCQCQGGGIKAVPAASQYFEVNLRASYAMCNIYRNDTACQLLGNLCVLTLYQYLTGNLDKTLDTACEMHLTIAYNERNFAPEHVPWLYYVSNSIDKLDGEDVLQTTDLPTVYTFDPLSYLEYRVARYSLDGNFIGLSNVLNGRLQLCADTSKKLNAAFTFGTSYNLEVNEDGEAKLFPIPVNILNYKSLDEGGDETNRGVDANKMLVRRFFMVDNVGNIPAAGGTTQGVIYPPALDIEYGKVTLADAEAGETVDISFTVEYDYDPNDYKRNFRISIGVLSTLGVLYAGYKTWCWSKRAGRPSIDFQTIVHFFFYGSGSLANVFFVVTFGMAFYWFIFFKRQSVVYLVHPTAAQLKDWTGLFGAAFALKFLEVAHMIFMQCMVDVFFIDWERSRGVVNTSADSTKTKEIPVSIWRTYFVANEWNEIQAIRKINKIFQVWATVFFLVVVGFEKTATRDPDGSVRKDDADYQSEYSHWIFFTFIYERFFEDKVRQFVDLCSMSNISVFVMAYAQWGHYIHGRSVHGKSDTNMREMFDMMKKEEEDQCSQRGLLPNEEQQTFMMALPRKLRQRYEALSLPARLEAASRMEQGRGVGPAAQKQSLKDCDYVVRPKNFLESIMDTDWFAWAGMQAARKTWQRKLSSMNASSSNNAPDRIYNNELTQILGGKSHHVGVQGHLDGLKSIDGDIPSPYGQGGHETRNRDQHIDNIGL